jgi:gamma-glutamyltranspeptidase / glutathione hydrolase
MSRSLNSMLIAAAALLAAVSFAPSQTAPPAQAPILTNTARFLPVIAKHGMVASQEKRATHVGVEILKAGGNAVDAAVAAGFALAVTHPQAGNIGGGGFMLVHLA